MDAYDLFVSIFTSHLGHKYFMVYSRAQTGPSVSTPGVKGEPLLTVVAFVFSAGQLPDIQIAANEQV